MSTPEPTLDTATNEYLAAKWRNDPPYDIATRFMGDVTENDRDGVCWEFAVMGGGPNVGTIVATVSNTNGGHRGMDVDPADLEARVEHFSGRFPRESRFDDLIAASPITLDLERPAPLRSEW